MCILQCLYFGQHGLFMSSEEHGKEFHIRAGAILAKTCLRPTSQVKFFLVIKDTSFPAVQTLMPWHAPIQSRPAKYAVIVAMPHRVSELDVGRSSDALPPNRLQV